jgi:hypothetical protein
LKRRVAEIANCRIDEWAIELDLADDVVATATASRCGWVDHVSVALELVSSAR